MDKSNRDTLAALALLFCATGAVNYGFVQKDKNSAVQENKVCDCSVDRNKIAQPKNKCPIGLII